MKAILTFVSKHWLTLVLLIGSLVFVIWIVQTKRPPGAMTVVEAQAMDMTAMKPPPGVFPVAVESAEMRSVGSSATYPAEVFAFSDEDVVARIMGRVQKILVYPGDHVKAGQLLASLQADETAAIASEARHMAFAKADEATSVHGEYEETAAMLAKAKAQVKMAEAGSARASLERDSAAIEQEKSKRELDTANAETAEMRADLTYADQELGRSKKLYQQGAISLDELQSAQRERDAKAAKVRASEARAAAAQQTIRIAAKRTDATRKGVDEAMSALDAARADQAAAEAALKKHDSHAQAQQHERAAASASAGAAGTMAGYRDLRALSDGDVSERMVSPGTAVMPGMPVLKLKVIGKVRVQAELPQSLSSSVFVGTPVHIVGAGIDREAKVSSVFPTVSAETRTFRIEAIVANQDRTLKPGMFLQVKIGLSQASSQLAVRSSAVQIDADGGRYVWTIKEMPGGGKATDWTCTMHPEISEPGPGICPKCKMDLVPREGSGKFTVEKRSVTVGVSDGTYSAILSGLSEGDEVVWAGHEDLFPGAAVQKSEWGPNGPKALPQTGPAGPGTDGQGKDSTSASDGTGQAGQSDAMKGMDMGGRK